MDSPSLALLEQILKLVIAIAGVGGLVVTSISSLGVLRGSEKLDKLVASGVISSDSREEVQTLTRRQRTSQIAILSTIVVAAVMSIALFAFSVPSDRAFYKALQQRDASIFADSKSGRYYIARLLPDRVSLQSDTDLRDDMEMSKATFDMYANNAGFVLQFYAKQVDKMVKAGIHVRFLLTDWDDANKNLDAHAVAVHSSPAKVRAAIIESKRILDELMMKYKGDRGTYPGTLEVKYTRDLLLYSSWIRDRNTPNATAHVELQLHGGKDKWPSFRFGKDSGRLASYLAAEYENLWSVASAR